jgi:hypothetical protein
MYSFANGQIRAGIPAGGVQDAAGNPNAASSSSDNTVTINILNKSAFDYDGDGKADLSVFRPSAGSWYISNSSNNQFIAIQFGVAEDKPLVGDFDGDGKSDLTVFRPSNGT